jgi:hypothetical protein
LVCFLVVLILDRSKTMIGVRGNIHFASVS